VLATLVFLSVLTLIVENNSKYVTFDFWDRFQGLKESYGASQYVIKNPEGWIPDEIVNAYAGAEYVKYGVSPILIAADTPPLGRYLIGGSALLTGNENLFILISALGSLIILYILGKKAFNSSIIAIIPVLLLSLEPLFRNQIKYTPLLDIMQLFFMLLAFLCFIYGREKKISIRKVVLYFSLASVFLGLFIATKFYVTGITIVAAWYFVLLWNREYKKAVVLTFVLPISIIVLLLNYIQLLFQGYSLREFLGVQRYIFEYHTSQLIKPFAIWPFLLLNRWHVWWGNVPVLSDPQWRITWPILTINAVILGILYLLKQIPRNVYVEPLLVWVGMYIFFFSFGQFTARYLVILLPILYLLFFYSVWLIFVKKNNFLVETPLFLYKRITQLLRGYRE